MSKIPLGIGVGLGAWTSGMGVTALTSISDSEEVEVLPYIKFPFIQEAKSKHKELPCVSYLFDEVTWNTNLGTASISSLSSEGIEGCLAVWWDAESYDENWKGSLNLLWGMKDNSSGMIFLSGIKADNGKVSENAILYTLKKGNENKWSLVSSTTGLTQPEIKDKNKIILPKKELMDLTSEWNFDFDFNKICSSTKLCTSELPKQTISNLNWRFVNEGEVRIYAYEWIENLDRLLVINSTIKSRLFNIKGHFEPL